MTRRQIRFWLAGLSLPVVLAAAPLAASAQTPAPAAGNPAINTTPPESGSGAATMASASSATPSSQAADSWPPGQTADNPNATPDQAAPSSGGDTDAMPQGKYASPPDLLPQSQQ